MIKFNLERSFFFINFQLHFPKGAIRISESSKSKTRKQDQHTTCHYLSVSLGTCVCVFTRLLRCITSYNQMETAFFCYREKAYKGTSACLEVWQIPVNEYSHPRLVSFP